MDDKPLTSIRRAAFTRWLAASAYSQTDLARKLGLSRSYLNSLFKPGKPFGEKAARSLEEGLGMVKGFLDDDGQTVNYTLVHVWSTLEELPPNSFALIQMHGENTQGSRRSPLAIRVETLRLMTFTSGENLKALEVHGDSMSDFLMDDDTAIIDLGQTLIKDGEVYAFKYAGGYRIRRLFTHFNGGVSLRNDNAKHGEELLTPEQAASLEILGRVLWRGG